MAAQCICTRPPGNGSQTVRTPANIVFAIFPEMIVCSCNVLSDHEIRNVATAAQVQPLSAHQVYGCLGCNIRCGRCARTIKQIISEALDGRSVTGAPVQASPDRS
jgi:bacterioferritin-associated ferredoxin